MTIHAQRAHALPFFLTAAVGERFCLYHQPDPDVPERGAILYVHPFAEELNKSRRMAALQARAYARAGYGVLQLDLYGCGDSSGDFSDARWHSWLDDLALGWQWLAQRGSAPRYLWGLRLGALLALQFAARAQPAPAGLVLWQPVISGRAHLNQFMRMQSAARMFGAAPPVQPADGGDAGTEVAGYRLAPELIEAIKQTDASFAPPCPVQWLELATPPAPPALQPASALLIERWSRAGAYIDAFALDGEPFWATPEITEVPGLLAATLNAMPVLAERS
ncbi:hydrolase 2, exosortase A system-associated [Duganella sp. LjRoot269]|jgi:exosortase A-associated hydrolase 2|uniref:hydrolase 2, exosortase A system-associated n=1 Tax=Duganella sp. LjRoot269 TaxID=3342305 RepID=UPI003ECEC94A